MRMGCLPFYGAFTLFTAADPDDLGDHAYRGGTDERERGIVYACRGGFLDISHIRKTGDLVPYCQVRIETALRHKVPVIHLRSREPSIYHVHFNYPAWWDRLSDDQRDRAAHDLSIRLAGHLAFYMVTWHEVITWHGYKSWGFISESRSAFAYDDGPSHMLGVVAAVDALRDNTRPYDPAMTHALNNWLDRLGVVSTERLHEAIRAVENKWWAGSTPLRRSIDSAFGDGAVTPWLVPGLAACPDARPHALRLPRLDAVDGRPLENDFWRVMIEPNVAEARAIRRVLETDRPEVDYHRDVPVLLDDIRAKLIAEHGPDAISP
jgi:hypothetical protein